MEQETTETDSEQKNKQGNTTLEQNAETVSNTVAKGIHANIYKVELGHNTNVLNQTTGKVETIEKGSIITIYATAVAFEKMFVFIFNDTKYHLLQTEIDDGMIKKIVPRNQVKT